MVSQRLVSLKQLTTRILATPIPDLPPPKVFKPKYDIPQLHSYKSNPDSEFWNLFPKNYTQPAKSMVNHHILKSLALESNFRDVILLETICKDLHTGANIGCFGASRLPSFSTNAPSAFEFGPHVTDAIADWIHKGFAYGPIPLDQIPPTAKISGIMTKPKPNGSVRIILNLSAPLGQAVNEGINPMDFPTVMSSTNKWLKALHLAGRNAEMCKIDWSDAYKHIAVSLEDTNLQWFTWLGMGFKELCLIFGGASSAGIFDRLAKVVVHIVAHKSNFPTNRICQHLDDCCAAAPAGSGQLARFDSVFYQVAGKLGIKLAPRVDPEKSFGPNCSGLVLGIFYDTNSWTWALNHEKLSRLLHDLKEFLTVDSLPQERVWSLVGKLIHIRPLIPNGKFNMHHLLQANNKSNFRTFPVIFSRGFKRQAHFWFSMIRLCSGRGRLPNPFYKLPSWAVDVYTDSAGGSMSSVGLGAGAVTPGWWAYLPWSRAINLGRPAPSGRSLSRSMSALELVGPLAVLAGGYSWCKNNYIRIWVDNAGSVFIWRKGYSTSCPLSTTLVGAISTVATGLCCSVEICKITRCSSPLASMADALSNADFNRFWSLAATANISIPAEMATLPGSLLCWIADPTPDDYPGDRILRDLSLKTSVLGYNC